MINQGIENKYTKIIKDTKNYALDALLLSGRIRDYQYSIFFDLICDFTKCLEDEFPEHSFEKLEKNLKKNLHIWNNFSKLYSANPKDVVDGAGELSSYPSSTLRKPVLDLKKKYNDDNPLAFTALQDLYEAILDNDHSDLS